MANDHEPTAIETELRRQKAEQILNFWTNIFANRLAIRKSRFGWPNIIRDQATEKTGKAIAYGHPYAQPQITSYELRRQFEMRKTARATIPPYDRSLLPAVIQKPVNLFPYRKYDFVGKDRTTYDTNWAYRQAESTPTGMDFFAPVTAEQAASFREEDEDTRQRKHNRYKYLRRQAKRRREEIDEHRHNKWQYLCAQVERRRKIYDQYKWLKPIAKANPTIAKNLPKIAKGLDSLSEIGLGRFAANPYAAVAMAAVHGASKFINAQVETSREATSRELLGKFYGKPPKDIVDLLAATGVGEKEATQLWGQFSALRGQLQRGVGVSRLAEAAGRYGLTSAFALADPALSNRQALQQIARDSASLKKMFPDGESRVANALAELGIGPELLQVGAYLSGEKFSREAVITKSVQKEVDKARISAWYPEWAAKLYGYTHAGEKERIEFYKKYGPRGIETFEPVLHDITFGLLGRSLEEIGIENYRKSKEAAQSLTGGNVMPLSREAAQSLNDSNIRAADADIAAMTNYSLTTERPVTVVIQGDIRTDADSGQRLYDDIDKRYSLGSLADIAEPVAKSFDSRIKR